MLKEKWLWQKSSLSSVKLHRASPRARNALGGSSVFAPRLNLNYFDREIEVLSEYFKVRKSANLFSRMRKLIGVALFLLLVCGTYAVGIHTSFEFSTGTNLPTDWQVDQGVPWGLGFGLKVTPTWEDLMDTNATIVNNTDLFYSFTTVPAQMLLEPSSFTFRVTVPASVVTIASDADVAFTPSSLVLRFTPVNMSATLRPSVWSFNLTNDNIVLPQNEDVLLEYTEACYLAGTTTTCDIVTPTSTQQTPLAKAISR